MQVRSSSFAALLGVLVLFAGCAGGDDAEEAPVPAGEQVPAVADSVIENRVQESLDADPRLDKEGIEIEAHSTNQEVTLVGKVPSRYEMSIAQGNAQSVLGVKRVYLDSLVVEADLQEGAGAATSTSPDTAAEAGP